MRLHGLSHELCQHLYDADKKRVEEFEFRNQSSWYFQSHDLVYLATTAYVLGRPLDEVRDWLQQATVAYRELFSLRGTTVTTHVAYRDGTPLPEESVPSDGFTSIESFEAALVSLILRDISTARQLVDLAGDSPEASLVSPTSQVCTTNQQALSQALNALLALDMEFAQRVAGTVAFGLANQIEKQIALMMISLGEADYPMALSERDALLFYHEKIAKRTDNRNDRGLWLSLPALGLTSLAMHLSGCPPEDWKSESLYCPVEMILGPE